MFTGRLLLNCSRTPIWLPSSSARTTRVRRPGCSTCRRCCRRSCGACRAGSDPCRDRGCSDPSGPARPAPSAASAAACCRCPCRSTYWTLKVSPCDSRFDACSVSALKVESPIDCTSKMWLNRGSTRLALTACCRSAGRRRAAPIGLIEVDVGHHRQVVAVRVDEADRRGEVAGRTRCSSCTLVCQVRATWKSGSTRPTATASTSVPVAEPGSGTPARRPRVAVERVGGRLRRAAQLQRLLVAAENRLVVHDAGAGAQHRSSASTAHATPARGPKLFLSMLNSLRLRERRVRQPSGYW